MDKASIETALNKAGLKHLVTYSTTLLRPTLRLRATPATEQAIAVGAIKMGGTPDLPSNLQWPEYKGVPQSFIAQFRLSDLQTFEVAKQLPKKGMLWFFYDANKQTYGENPGDADGWRILYHPDEQQLKRTTFPAQLPAKARFHAATLTLTPELTLAQQPQLELPELAWNDDDQAKYDPIFEQFYNEADTQAPRHQLFGYPYTLQDDMREQCQLVTNNITDANDPRANEVLKGANDWQLLLQVDSDDDLNMQWGSAGMLYYWIKQADLQAQRFGHSWLVLQSD
jgi:uncharacterized protein YwqG